MQIKFSDIRPSDAALVAQITNKGKLPDGLEATLAKGAEAARFKGTAGQVFESFAERDGKVVRVALAGAGDASAKARAANLEKAGAALAAKYMTSGETGIAVDFADSGLSASEAAAVLLGLRLRAWRYDVHRTKMKAEEKITLTTATVLGAPQGTAEAWADLACVAEGIEFTRELVTEPANVIYPVSFVERCRERFADTGAEITVLDEPAMEKLGMGALLGVGQGLRPAKPAISDPLEWRRRRGSDCFRR